LNNALYLIHCMSNSQSLARCTLWFAFSFIGSTFLSAQHDRERNAFRQLAEGKVEKAYFELKTGKKHSDPAEKAFISTLCLLKEGNDKQALSMAKQAVEIGLPFERFLAEPREWLKPLRESKGFQLWKKAVDPSLIIHGPMVGQVSDSSASFWFRTDGACEVGVEINGHTGRETVKTSEQEGFVGVVNVDGLLPGTYFSYRIFVNGKEFLDPSREFGFRTFSEPEEGAKFTIAFGGCSGFVPEYESVWELIANYDPRAMLMLGDNVYIDDPEDVQWTGDYCYSRRHSRPEWKKLISKTSMHSIYDDHDFGTDDCIPGFLVDQPVWKKPVLKNFIKNWNNPVVGGGDENPGCWQTFTLGQVQIIMLDCRYYRDREKKSMLGQIQKKWLKKTLSQSKAKFKIIASSVPFSKGIKPGSKDPWDGYPEEREEIFSFIEKEKIEGVLLIAADRHRIDLRKTERVNGYDLFEFVSGRLTNRHVHSVIKTEGLIWGYNKTCGFCLLRFDTRKVNSQVKLEAYDNEGKLLFAQKIMANDLKFTD
jgi:alkaline phosphatase D